MRITCQDVFDGQLAMEILDLKAIETQIRTMISRVSLAKDSKSVQELTAILQGLVSSIDALEKLA
jgi:hypothetical protein